MPDQQEFVDVILQHYENPRHGGKLENPDATASGRNLGCGDTVTIYLRVDDKECIAEAAFEADGCTISRAAASIVTDAVIGKALTEVAALDQRFLLAQMGPGVMNNRRRCAVLALNVAKAAAEEYRAGHSG